MDTACKCGTWRTCELCNPKCKGCIIGSDWSGRSPGYGVDHQFLVPHTCFEGWMREVNEKLVELSGLQSEDLPDYDYRIAYDLKRPVNWVVEAVLTYAGFPGS